MRIVGDTVYIDTCYGGNINGLTGKIQMITGSNTKVVINPVVISLILAVYADDLKKSNIPCSVEDIIKRMSEDGKAYDERHRQKIIDTGMGAIRSTEMDSVLYSLFIKATTSDLSKFEQTLSKVKQSRVSFSRP